MWSQRFSLPTLVAKEPVFLGPLQPLSWAEQGRSFLSDAFCTSVSCPVLGFPKRKALATDAVLNDTSFYVEGGNPLRQERVFNSGEPTLATGGTPMRERTKEAYIMETKVLHMVFPKFPAGVTGSRLWDIIH